MFLDWLIFGLENKFFIILLLHKALKSNSSGEFQCMKSAELQRGKAPWPPTGLRPGPTGGSERHKTPAEIKPYSIISSRSAPENLANLVSLKLFQGVAILKKLDKFIM